MHLRHYKSESYAGNVGTGAGGEFVIEY